VGEGLRQPLSREGDLLAWHLIGAGFLAINGILFAQGGAASRVIGANVLAPGFFLLLMGVTS
jgi:hypothetical protein